MPGILSLKSFGKRNQGEKVTKPRRKTDVKTSGKPYSLSLLRWLPDLFPAVKSLFRAEVCEAEASFSLLPLEDWLHLYILP